MNIGERIKQLRIQNNMTLEELGQRVGVGKSTVRKWETGAIANMRRDKIQKLADALDTTVLEIMGLEEPPVPPPPAPSFSAEEQRLVVLYRRADDRDRETVWNILGRYDEETTGAHTSAG